MESLVEKRGRHFYAWERRGRGWQSYPYPVPLAPPFRPFRYLRETTVAAVDDGRHPTPFSAILERWFGGRQEPPPAPVEEGEPEPEPRQDDSELIEVQLLPPEDLSVTPALSQAWLRSLASLRAPASFELVATGGTVAVLLSCRSQDAPLPFAQLRAFFPQVEVREGQDLLLSAWEQVAEGTFSVLEFGLAHEFMLPLAQGKSFSPDPLTSIVAALAEAKAGEFALLQVLFERVSAPWPESIVRSVQTPSGEPFFADAPEVTSLAREKASAPLFAVAVRAMALAPSGERLWTLLRGIGGALSSATQGGNELVPLGQGDLDDLLGDVLFRTTHRSGCLLSLPELSTLVHLPSASVQAIVRETGRTKEVPPEARDSGVVLGYGVHQGKRTEARLSDDARMRHVHVIGAPGTGKSTLLVSLILQDIAAGNGVGVLDPHGDLVDEVLARLPEERAQDVILFDPADPEYVVGWNMLSASSEAEKEMLASDLVAVFRRLSTSWGDQMTAVLANAIGAFLESRDGGTLLDLRRFLVDPGFRKRFLETVPDALAREFWTTHFPMLKGSPQGPILTRLDSLLRGRLVRGVVTATERPLDFRRVVDDGRIFLGKLSQGAIGEENASLLGSLLVSKFHQVSLLRQDQAEAERRPFFLYVDEFHGVATPSMAALFSGARKYRLSVTVAHQDLYQLHSRVPDVERAVLANAYTRVCFRLGDEDARALAHGFSFFTADDLGNLGTGEAVCRVGRKEQDFNLETIRPEPLTAAAAREQRRAMRMASLKKWGVLRPAEVEPPPTVADQAREPRPPQEARTPERQGVEPPATPRPAREAKPPAPQVPSAAAPHAEPRRLGKGGAEHTYLQELISRWAVERGFRAAVEEQIAGGRESVDLALHRGQFSVACEISVTTPLDYEVGNVEKCLAAGFPMVAVVSLKKARLEKLDKLLTRTLSADQRSRVHVFTPEELLAWLAGQPAAEETSTVAGYKVKVRYREAPEARKRVAEILARSMRRLKKDE
ncbi:MAG TPA: type IV secretion system DNA-binding domain-containing protein [Thermoanaerobaculia bacterium]|nr:type IV secretion system DNA-binding domain-containing protein [Thermoanaerobaculia bacterium]